MKGFDLPGFGDDGMPEAMSGLMDLAVDSARVQLINQCLEGIKILHDTNACHPSRYEAQSERIHNYLVGVAKRAVQGGEQG